jgi:hypothetical protein
MVVPPVYVAAPAIVSVPVPYFNQWARKRRPVKRRPVRQERRIRQRIVVGKPKLQDHRLREVAGDVVKGEDAAAKGADRKNIDRGIVSECTDLAVRQPRPKRSPVGEIADRIAVGRRNRALRIGHIVETAREQRIHAIIGNKFERRWSDNARWQVACQICDRCTLIRCAEKVCIIGYEISQL